LKVLKRPGDVVSHLERLVLMKSPFDSLLDTFATLETKVLTDSESGEKDRETVMLDLSKLMRIYEKILLSCEKNLNWFISN